MTDGTATTRLDDPDSPESPPAAESDAETDVSHDAQPSLPEPRAAELQSPLQADPGPRSEPHDVPPLGASAESPESPGSTQPRESPESSFEEPETPNPLERSVETAAPQEPGFPWFGPPSPQTVAGPAEVRSVPEPAPLTTIERLRDGILTDRLAGWIVTLSITVLAFVIRFVNLAYPNKLIFDETYYAKDAYTLWKYGYEREWPKDTADPSIVAGLPDVYLNNAEFAVHPPVGKWLIGLGEHLFGMNSFGWRFMPLVFGTLLVFITIRLARRLSRSTLIGAVAGILLTFDGLAFTMSRIALLDIFQAFFLVMAVSAVVADRDYYRHRLADRLETAGHRDFAGEFGPMIWWRPWRLLAGVAFGLALGTKWNSIFVLAVMGIVSVLWDVGARRLAGAGWRSWLALVIDGIPAFVRMVVVAAAVYLSTWTGWLLSSGGYDRQWGLDNPDSGWTRFLGEGWASLLKLHQDILAFHTGDYIRNATHPYDAHPIGWLVMARPIALDSVNKILPGVDGCTAVAPEYCTRVMIAMGTPVLWWMAVVALVVAVIWWIGGRDWRFGVPVVAALATYLPWFASADRPVFFFYAITIVPFTVIALAMVLGLILGPAAGRHRRRGAIISGVAVALVILNFAYIYPLLTGGILYYQDWLSRMWLRSWI